MEDLSHNLNWYQSAFVQFENTLNGEKKSEFHSIRKQAFSILKDRAIPSPKDEEWKYTNVSHLGRSQFTLAATPSSQNLEAYKAAIDACTKETERLVFVNGRFSSDLSSFDSTSPGVSFTTLGNSDLFGSDKFKWAKRELERELKDQNINFFSLLNSSYLTDGAVIDIGENAELAKPIVIVFISDTSGAQAIFPRLYVRAGKNSHSKVIELHLGVNSGEYLTTPVSFLDLDSDACLTHYKTQLDTSEATHISSSRISLSANSKYTNIASSLGGKLVRNDISANLAGEHCECILDGVSIAENNKHIDNSTIINHQEPNTYSRELYKGIYSDTAKGVFSGTIVVDKKAQKTNAIQSNGAILLSDSASIDTRPQLKIWADDVKCTHGATVGQLDKEALFYLRSRGLSFAEAKKLLVAAFINEVTDQIEDEVLRRLVENHVSKLIM